jgi:hypothetical protein
MPYRRQAVQDARRSRLSRSRSEISSLIRSNHGAVRQRQPVYRPRIPKRPKSAFPGTVHQQRCAVPPLTSLTVAAPVCAGRHYRMDSPPDSPIGLAALRSTASRSMRICLFLVPLVVPILPRHSRNRSGKSARRGKKDRVSMEVGQHRPHRLGQSKHALRILETAGSTTD